MNAERGLNGEDEHEKRDYHKLMVKKEVCRRFRRGVCRNGAKCEYAHSVQEIRRQPKHCRLFLQNKHCPYGRNCRYLHSNPSQVQIQLQLQPQPELGKLDGYSCAEYKRMRTCAAAPSDDNSCSEYRMMQQPSTTAATNASTCFSHKNESASAVKSIFKHNDLQKISRIYADWI